MKKQVLACALCLLVLATCGGRKTESKGYAMRLLPSARITLDGKLSEPEWRQAHTEGDFSFPWEARMAPLTQFRAFVAGDALYFSFLVDDASLVVQPFTDESTLDKEDRVEIFFAKDDQLTPYYCLEIDPLGRVHDYEGRYHRKFDSAWKCEGLQVAGATNETGYVVEGSLPLAKLEQLGLPSLKAGQPVHMGLYRAEFSYGKDGAIDEHWISWVDPKVKDPDFHIPSSFGSLSLSR